MSICTHKGNAQNLLHISHPIIEPKPTSDCAKVYIQLFGIQWLNYNVGSHGNPYSDMEAQNLHCGAEVKSLPHT